MKITYLHQYFLFPEDSGGTRSFDLATSFVKKGDLEIEFITTSSFIKNYNFTKRWTILNRDGLVIHVLNLDYNNNLSYFRRVLVFLKFLWFSTFKLLSLKPDVVLATSTPLTIGIPALIKKWIHKTPFIFEVRDVWPEAVIAIGAIKNSLIQKVLFSLEKIIYKYANVIVPLSTDMQKSIVSRYPKFKSKTEVVIENISDINRFQNIKSSVNLNDYLGITPRFTLLYAGTFGKVNGIHKILELAEKTWNIDKRLVYLLIGSGSEKEKIIQLAGKKKLLNKNIFIKGPIPKNELPHFYSSISMASSFVTGIPELWANSANKFFDTLAASKPILINHSGWQAETISSYNIGYVLPFEITDEVAHGFVRYTHNKELLKTQGVNALELAKDKYSLEKATEKYLKILNEVIINV